VQAPEELTYLESHEWVRAENGSIRVGISDYAQDALGDIVYVDLPEVGAKVEAREIVAEVESTKSVGEIYAPVAGTIAAVNTALDETPELVNRDPYGAGWLFEVEPSAELASDSMMDAAAYRAFTEGP
jgi:glycine cleavage system H protein